MPSKQPTNRPRRSRRAALASYGELVDDYNRAFHAKWISGGRAGGDEPLLGSSDIQSLADLDNSFRFVEEMGVVPFGKRAVIQLAFATVLPWAPLVLLVVPASKIVDALTKVVF